MLFPSLITFWRLNGIEKKAIPNFIQHLTLMCFGTREYAGPFHLDSHDTMFTIGLRLRHGLFEPDTAYQFCLVDNRLIGSTLGGIVIEQSSGSIGLWKGETHIHASSCDTRVDKDKHIIGSVGLIMTQKPLLLKQTLRHRAETMELAEVPSFPERFEH